jgi:hypothetical protein
MRHLSVLTLIVATLFTLASCSKDKNPSGASLFYGKWKSNAGDTITFSQKNGENVFTYGSFNLPSLPSEVGFSYQNNKLGLKDDLANPSRLRALETFKWIQQGTSFEVQGADMYLFMSSTSTYFTFTKIP